MLIRNGQIDTKALQREALSREELIEVIHRQGFEHLHEVKRCELEPNGGFFVEGHDPTLADKNHGELLEKLDKLSKQIAALQGEA